MSVLHQQRIRIAAGLVIEDPWLPEETILWTATCPCCFISGELSTWPEALAWADNHLRRFHCRFCLDGQMPAGRCEFMGALFERCPLCRIPCPDCDGIAVYPIHSSP